MYATSLWKLMFLSSCFLIVLPQHWKDKKEIQSADNERWPIPKNDPMKRFELFAVKLVCMLITTSRGPRPSLTFTASLCVLFSPWRSLGWATAGSCTPGGGSACSWSWGPLQELWPRPRRTGAKTCIVTKYTQSNKGALLYVALNTVVAIQLRDLVLSNCNVLVQTKDARRM